MPWRQRVSHNMIIINVCVCVDVRVYLVVMLVASRDAVVPVRTGNHLLLTIQN